MEDNADDDNSWNEKNVLTGDSQIDSNDKAVDNTNYETVMEDNADDDNDGHDAGNDQSDQENRFETLPNMPRFKEQEPEAKETQGDSEDDW